MINPAKLLTLKKEWEGFAQRHPRFMQFIMTIFQNGMGVGSVIDVTVTLPDGRSFQSNMRLTQEDVDLVKNIGSMM